MPQELDVNERDIRRLEIERQALKKESDAPSKERLKKIDEELNRLKETNKAMRLRWQNEKAVIDRIRATKAQIEEKKSEEIRAEKVGDLNRVAEIRYGTLVGLNKELEAGNKELSKLQKDGGLLKEEVDDRDIVEIIAKWTRIPLAKLMQAETEKLVHMEDALSWARMRPLRPLPHVSAARAPAFPTPIARRVLLFLSGLPESVKRS
jgi:ATP-dependent Clp protease ATP-binding subunit ClpB